MEETTLHTVDYSLVYKTGWTYGNYQAQATSDNPSDCAHMILLRSRSNEIVGVRIHAIDGERYDYLHLPENGGY